MKEAVDLGNVQGIVRHGYGRCDAARFVLLGVVDPVMSRRWLAGLSNGTGGVRIEDARRPPERGQSCVNVAFTFEGLQRLGVDPQALAQFSREFQEGMTGSEHRSRVLGDHGDSDPKRWRWGGPDNPAVHLLLMLYASRSTISGLYSECAAQFAAYGLEQVALLPESAPLPGFKEHFGFVDGIAQPQVEGLEKNTSNDELWEGNRVKLGEVLLGYANEYGQPTERPLLGAEADPGNMLLTDIGGSGKRDLGRDGTYLVFRQLGQDVAALWRFVDDATGGHGRESPDAMIALASKMVGRWPSGASLARLPDADAPTATESPTSKDRFDYDDDPHGFFCPLGSHVRRTNPRGSMLPENGGATTKDQALEISRRHRIVRRGRAFGPPLDTSMDPRNLLAASPDTRAERGLHFLCLSANIARQFEFLQQAWIDNPKFQGLYDDGDPLIGARGRDGGSQAPGGAFSVPARPVRRRYQGLPRFVDVLGGAYFFLPSLAAIRFLSAQS